MTETRTVSPSFVACRIDMSRYCEQEFLDRCGGKVFLSGFFDDSVNVHLCSLTPAVLVEGLEFVPESYPEDEALRDALNEELLANDATDAYYDRSTIERMRKVNPDHFVELDLTFDEDEDPADETREHLQGNPVF